MREKEREKKRERERERDKREREIRERARERERERKRERERERKRESNGKYISGIQNGKKLNLLNSETEKSETENQLCKMETELLLYYIQYKFKILYQITYVADTTYKSLREKIIFI